MMFQAALSLVWALAGAYAYFAEGRFDILALCLIMSKLCQIHAEMLDGK